MSGRVAVFLVGGMTLSGGLFGSSWGAPGIVGIRRSVEEEEGGREGERTPLRADFAAKLALRLCLPPMGAVDDRVSTICTRVSYCVQGRKLAGTSWDRVLPLAPSEQRWQYTSFS